MEVLVANGAQDAVSLKHKRKNYRLAWASASGLLFLLALNVWFDIRNSDWAVIDVLAIAVAAVLLFRKYRRHE